MNITLSQIFFLVFICFLLFGDISNTFQNLAAFIKKLNILISKE